jgi:hypothetical protein
MRLPTLFIMVLLAGCVAAPAPTATPFPSETPTWVASVTPTVQPTATFTVEPAVEITPTAAESPTPVLMVTINPFVELEMPPPLRIDLPEGWRYGQGAIPLPEGADGFGMIPVAIYTGQVTGGEGYITLLWGFRNIAHGAVLPGQRPTIDVWSDGVRLLYLAVMEPECSIGRDEPQNFKIGGLDARGSYFVVRGCPEYPDTRGWFAALTENGINFAFYVYTEPLEAMDGAAQQQLQAILNSVEFDMSLLPTPETLEAPGE